MKVEFVLAISTDTDEMPRSAAFNLVLNIPESPPQFENRIVAWVYA